jgi:hypothetical protein
MEDNKKIDLSAMMKKPEAETNNHVQDDSPNAEKKKIIKA